MFKIYDKMTEGFMMDENGDVVIADTLGEAIEKGKELAITPVIVDVDGDWLFGKVNDLIDRINGFLDAESSFINGENAEELDNVICGLVEIRSMTSHKKI